MQDTSIFSLRLPTNIPDNSSITPEKLPPRQKPSWHDHKQLFLCDLEKSGIPRATLDWQRSPTSPWNSTLLTFAVKHWERANIEGAFSHYPINPEHHGNLVCLAVFERWLRG